MLRLRPEGHFRGSDKCEKEGQGGQGGQRGHSDSHGRSDPHDHGYATEKQEGAMPRHLSEYHTRT